MIAPTLSGLAVAASLAGQSPPAIPLGVYWAGEFTWIGDVDRQQRVEAQLNLMQSAHVNALWLTHLSAEDTAWFCRLCEPRGISVVAALGELDGTVAWKRQRTEEQVQQLAQDTLTAWGDAPRPISWGMADEPNAAYIAELDTFIDRWRVATGGDPVTCTATWGELETASVTLACDHQSCNVYPFFAPGGGGYAVPEWQAWRESCRDNTHLNVQPWAMGQGFDQPGTWLRPTREQLRWQVYAALAEGNRGVFMFAWRHDKAASPWPITGLVNDNGTTTDLYYSLSNAFDVSRRVSHILAACTPDPTRTVSVSGGTASTFATVLSDEDGTDFLFVVGGYELGPQAITVNADGLPAVVREHPNKTWLVTKSQGPGRKLMLSLGAGTMALFQLNNFAKWR